MFASTALLTLMTLAGLAIGFAREMLLVASWGASAQTDAFLVAMFLPEAVRMAMTGGVLTSAALPLWAQQPAGLAQTRWAVTQTMHMAVLGIALALLLAVLAGPVVYLIGPGMSTTAHAQATDALRIVAWALPGILLQALLSVFHIARQHYLLSGLGSLVFNLPAVLYLFWFRDAGSITGLSLSFVAGSVLMTVILVPFAWNNGWRPAGVRPVWSSITALYRQLLPLLASNAASQCVFLIERIVASHLGEGAITLLNLARKLINIPLIGVLSLSQVLLSHMSKQIDALERATLLRTGLKWATLLSIPATVGFIFGAQPIVALLLPAKAQGTLLPQLISLFSIGIAFGSWAGLLARYFYAQSDTRTPLKFELSGNAINIVLTLSLAPLLGPAALPISACIGLIATTILLALRTPLAADVGAFVLQATVGSVAVLLLWVAQHHMEPLPTWIQLSVAVILGAGALAGLTMWFKPWKTSTSASGTTAP
jgi:murein biosynthesis integral membrane protein MurJ